MCAFGMVPPPFGMARSTELSGVSNSSLGCGPFSACVGAPLPWGHGWASTALSRREASLARCLPLGNRKKSARVRHPYIYISTSQCSEGQCSTSQDVKKARGSF